jgi:hypothetical protein
MVHMHGAIAMTPDLGGDVPVPYFSWNDYKMMRPVEVPTVKKVNAMAAFISNCAASSFRLDAIMAMVQAGQSRGPDSWADKVEENSEAPFPSSLHPDAMLEAGIVMHPLQC